MRNGSETRKKKKRTRQPNFERKGESRAHQVLEVRFWGRRRVSQEEKEANVPSPLPEKKSARRREKKKKRKTASRERQFFIMLL